MTIKKRLLIGFLSTILPTLFVMSLSFIQARNTLQESCFLMLDSMADLEVKRVEAYFDDLIDEIQIAQNNYSIKINLPVMSQFANNRNDPVYLAAKQILDDQLRVWLNEDSGLVDVKLISPDGNMVYGVNSLFAREALDHPLSDLGGNAFQEGKSGVYMSKAFLSETRQGRVSMLVTAPATDLLGHFIGVIVYEVDVGNFLSSIQDIMAWSETGEVLVARLEGDHAVFLNPLHYDPDAALKRKIIFGQTTAYPIQMAVRGQQGAGIQMDYRSVEVISVWRYIPALNWGFVLKVDTAEAFAGLLGYRNLTFILVFIVSIVLVVMGISSARTISEPIETLREGVGMLRKGHLDHRVGTDHHDEIGELSRAFDQMVDNLKEEIDERVQAEQNLRDQTKEIVAGANILVVSTQKVSTGITQLVSATAENTAAVSQTTTTVEEVKQTTQVVNERTEQVSKRAQLAEKISQTGRQAAQDAIGQIHRIQDQMAKIANSIVQLSERSQAIGKLLSGVDDLATQSNLLAVNAAIESAKAGEEGKGFGVVAEQIKHLSEQSKLATKQIATLLSDIRAATLAAVSAAEQGGEAMTTGVAQSVRAGEAIDKLADSVAATAQSAIQISASTNQQLAGMNQVVRAMESILESSEQNANSTRQVELAAHDLGALGQRLQVLAG
jgi:methyl-accepting chemotaxis protein